jgi:hypothetical protein
MRCRLPVPKKSHLPRRNGLGAGSSLPTCQQQAPLRRPYSIVIILRLARLIILFGNSSLEHHPIYHTRRSECYHEIKALYDSREHVTADSVSALNVKIIASIFWDRRKSIIWPQPKLQLLKWMKLPTGRDRQYKHSLQSVDRACKSKADRWKKQQSRSLLIRAK